MFFWPSTEWDLSAMGRIYWVLKSLLYVYWWSPLVAILLLGPQFLLVGLMGKHNIEFDHTDRYDRSDQLVAGYWSYRDRKHLHGGNDLSEVQQACRALSADGTVAFHTSSGVLEHCAQELSAVSGADSDIRSLLGGVRRMQFLNCGFTTGDWSLLSQLSDLEVVEFCGVKRTPEEASEAYIRSSAAALSKLPRLQTLLLSGESFLGVGRMPELRTLGLELWQVEQFLTGDVSGRFPLLETILIRIPSEGEVSKGVYASLRGINQLREVHLWSGDEGSAGLLTKHVDEFRRELPGLLVRRRDWGLSFHVCFLWGVLQLGLVVAGMSIVAFTHSLSSREANVFIPGLCRAHQQVLVMMYLLAAAGGFLLAWYLGVRAWVPVLLTLLSMSLPAALADAVPGRSGQSVPLLLRGWNPLPILMALVLVPVFFRSDTAFLCDVLNGDNFLLNLVLLSVAAGAVPVSISAIRRRPGRLAESGQLSLQRGAAGGVGNMQVMGVNDRLLQGDLADRLRAGCGMRNRRVILITLMFIVPQLLLSLAGGETVGKSIDRSIFWIACAPVFMVVFADQAWLQRRFRLWSDFVMPCSRLAFWRAVRVAVFRELRWSYLLVMLLPPALLPIGIAFGDIKAGQSILPLVLLWSFSVAGMFLLHHGMLCWGVVSGSWYSRLSSVSIISLYWHLLWLFGPIVFGGAVSNGAIVLSFLMLLAGGLMQWRLPAWLESAEYPSKRAG
ncbi:MAG: hypothetical protein ACK5DR_22285 [Planctomyces sp.]